MKRETGREGPRVAPGLLTSNPRSQPLCTAFALRRGGSCHLSSVPYFTCDPSPTAAAPHLPSGLASVAGHMLSPFTRLWVCEGPAARSPGARGPRQLPRPHRARPRSETPPEILSHPPAFRAAPLEIRRISFAHLVTWLASDFHAAGSGRS